MNTTLDQKLKIDKDKIAVKNTVNTILHMLNKFIPEACYREAMDYMYEQFLKDGIELTNKEMRKEYESWKSEIGKLS